MIIIYILIGLVGLLLLVYMAYQAGTKNAVECTTIPLFVLNTQGEVIHRNSAAKDFYLPTVQIEGMQYISTDLALYLQGIGDESSFCYKFIDSEQEREFSFEGRKCWFNAQQYWLVSVRRQVDKASAEENLKQSKRLLHHIIQSLPDAVGMMNDNYQYEACNDAFVQALRISSPDKLIGKRLVDVADPDIAEKFLFSDKRVLETGKQFHIIDETFDRFGNRQWLEARKIAYIDPVTQKRGLFIFARDISEKERAKEKLSVANNELKRLSFLDGLTNIGNRRYFEETLVAEWQSHIQTQMPLSLICCEVDSWQDIVEDIGVNASEKVLVDLADKLEGSLLRVEDRVYRYSDNEFIFILSNTNATSAQVVKKRVIQQLHQLETEVSSLAMRIEAYTCFPDVKFSPESAVNQLKTQLTKTEANRLMCAQHISESDGTGKSVIDRHFVETE